MEKNSRNKKILGAAGEGIAERFYRQRGCSILEKNFIFKHGEIDLIVKDKEELVFVEVKTRHGSIFGAPEESVTPLKQHLLRRTAEGYIWLHHLEHTPCRFDVLAVTTEGGIASTRCLPNAF
jgi:putative endonuclease